MSGLLLHDDYVRPQLRDLFEYIEPILKLPRNFPTTGEASHFVGFLKRENVWLKRIMVEEHRSSDKDLPHVH